MSFFTSHLLFENCEVTLLALPEVSTPMLLLGGVAFAADVDDRAPMMARIPHKSKSGSNFMAREVRRLGSAFGAIVSLLLLHQKAHFL